MNSIRRHAQIRVDRSGMMSDVCNVALIGQKFMGRAHSNGFAQARRFFTLKRPPALHVVAGRQSAELAEFAGRWGWSSWTSRWQDIIDDPAVHLVDIATPNDLHADIAIEMLRAGKHVACEKPLAATLDEARSMRDAARRAKGRTYVWFNYRRCPAVGLAHRLVREGRIGRIYHVRAHYLQSWGGASTPLLWRFQKKFAGSGAHGDLNAHIVDMARFITGDEINEIHGAVARTFIKERLKPGTKITGRCDVDDAVLFLAGFKGGAVGSFEASRLAGPHQNANSIEINGEAGSLRFDFEDMNILHFYDAADGKRAGGWRRIMCTAAGDHPYAANWWPDAHVIGYEHTFANMAADIFRDLAGEPVEVPLPDFADACETQRVLEAALISAAERCAVRLKDIPR